MATDAVSNDPLQAVPVELRPVVDHLVTEDDTPVDNFFSEKQQRLLTEPLYSSWTETAGQRSFVAASNVGLFFAVRRPPLVPDVLLSLDVELPADLHPKSHRSYFVWEYGKPPDVVIEVVSNREGGEDSEKLIAYARVGIRYYVIFDPERLLGPEMLRIYRLEAREFHKMDEPIWFPDVGLGLRVWQGCYEDHDSTWLRWVDAEGAPISTGRERAESERQRADRLAEKLRQLGVAPPKP
jgi:Uma2 family endonuclease